MSDATANASSVQALTTDGGISAIYGLGGWSLETTALPGSGQPNGVPDCFWCGALLFHSRDQLVCPDDGSTYDAGSYLRTVVSST